MADVRRLVALLHHGAQEAKRLFLVDLRLKATESLDFDLPHAFAGEPDLTTDLLEREGLLALKAVAKANDARVAFIDLVKQLEHQQEFLPRGHILLRLAVAVVLEEFVEFGAFARLATRRLARSVVCLQCAAHDVQLTYRDLEIVRKFLHRRLTPELLFEPA